MPRTTRATLRAENIHVDNTATEDTSPDEQSSTAPLERVQEREPLGEIAPNRVDETAAVMVAAQEIASEKKGKGKGKAAKKDKKKADGEIVLQIAEQNAPDMVAPDDREVTASPASDAAVEELMFGSGEGEW